jgi:fucose permease
MSVYTLVFFGAMPLGSLIAGAVAEKFGEPLTVIMSAIILACFSVAAWAFLPDVRKQE